MEPLTPTPATDSVASRPPASAGSDFLALGDSYTIGQSVNEEDRFPNQTAAMLRFRGDSIANPEIIARTGWTTLNLQNAIVGKKISQPYRIVTLLIGVNDQFQTHDTAGYRERFHSLLKSAIKFAGDLRTHVFVLSIPDYSVTPFASSYDTMMIRTQIDQYNAINFSVSKQEAVNYVDITTSTREAVQDPTLIAADGLHPSGKEYKKWAMKLAELIDSSDFQ